MQNHARHIPFPVRNQGYKEGPCLVVPFPTLLRWLQLLLLLCQWRLSIWSGQQRRGAMQREAANTTTSQGHTVRDAIPSQVCAEACLVLCCLAHLVSPEHEGRNWWGPGNCPMARCRLMTPPETHQRCSCKKGKRQGHTRNVSCFGIHQHHSPSTIHA